MNEWFEFTLYAVSSLVSAVFDWDLGIGVSVGDFCLALAVLAIVAGALVVKSSHISSGDSRVNFGGGRGGSADFDK